MTYEAVEFEVTIQDGKIEIPAEYQDALEGYEVKVIVLRKPKTLRDTVYQTLEV